MSTDKTQIPAEYKSWRKSDTTWTLGLFGTAIGAGVLFFPIRAGYGGLIPILIMLVLAYPIAFLCHRALARLCLSGKIRQAISQKLLKSTLVKAVVLLSLSCTSSQSVRSCGSTA